jgi:hypothetical protein
VKKSYYTLKARLTPGWLLPHAKSLKVEQNILTGARSSQPADGKVWKDPPHVALANLGYRSDERGGVASGQDIVWFLRRFGELGLDLEEEGGVGGAAQRETPFEFRVMFFVDRQRDLREGWAQKDASLFTNPPRWRTAAQFLPVVYYIKGGRLEIKVASLDALMGILLTRDLAEGRAKMCERKNCPNPYFVATKKDARYCSHLCAGNVAVERFRDRRKFEKKTKGRKR